MNRQRATARHRLLILALASLCLHAGCSKRTKGMLYWFTVDKVPISSLDGQWRGLTHIVIGDVYVQSNGALTFQDPAYAIHIPPLVSAAHSHGAKVLLDIGPAGNLPAGLGNNPDAVVKRILAVVNRFRFDGVADDWEGGWENRSMHTRFLSAMRSALGSKLLFEVPDSNDWMYAGSVAQYVDAYTNLNYDSGGCIGNGSWFDAALHNYPSGIGNSGGYWSVDLNRTRAIHAGVPPEKLIIGVEFAVRVWSKGTPLVSKPLQQCGDGYHILDLNYANAVSKYNLLNPNRDPVTRVPWITTPDGWFADFEDPASLIETVNYVRQYNLGGWIAFNANMDYSPGQKPQHPLLAAMQAATLASKPLQPQLTPGRLTSSAAAEVRRSAQ